MISHFHCPINWNAWLEKERGMGEIREKLLTQHSARAKRAATANSTLNYAYK
ncbi:hypothetical protein [Nostoc sp. MS1]|uniref:hypothetical protein n=1 Tax=Nostoc sp. MS1 TaxID=2764711 RepID=UPI001CC41641|nr:hypothetical protein [Nostoc sp. MS1]